MTIIADASTRCRRCGRPLRDPASVARGIGPICAAREILADEGLDAHSKAARLRRLLRDAREAGEPVAAIAEIGRRLAELESELPSAAEEPDEDELAPPFRRPEIPPAFADLDFIDHVFRDVFAARLPGYEAREPQIQLARAVAEGLNGGRHVVAEAGTGTGKSLAYLVPAIYWAVRAGRRVVVSTGTIALQEQLVRKDIPFLQRVLDIPFRAILVKGKGNYLCKVRLDEEGEAQQLLHDAEFERIADWARTTTTGDRADLPFLPGDKTWERVNANDDCAGRKCPLYSSCHLFAAKQRAREADILICNHHLFLTDLNVRLRSGRAAAVLPEYHAVVFDEAHHIESIASEVFGAEVSGYRVPVLLRQVRRLGSVANLCVEGLEAANERLFLHWLQPGVRPAGSDKWIVRDWPRPLVDDLVIRLEGIASRLDLTNSGDAMTDDRAQGLARRARGIVRDLEDIGEAAADPGGPGIAWVEVADRPGGERPRVALHLTPVSVAEELRQAVFEHVHAAILTSATITTDRSFAFLRQQIGLDDADELIVESPFDYRNQCLAYIPRGLPEPNDRDGRWVRAIQPVILDVLRATRGRAFLLFTSYATLRATYDALADQLQMDGYVVLRQGEAQRTELVESFKRGNAVLFATSSFWEGVDVQGEALSCVIIDKLPFASPADPIVAAKTAAIDRAGGNAFAQYQVPQAIIRMKQGFGRLIRSRSDKGLFVCLDTRLKTKPYGSKFLRSLPACREIWSLDEATEFLGGDPPALDRHRAAGA